MGKKGKQKRIQRPSTAGTDGQGDTCEIKTLEQYKNKGKEINERYCVFKDNTPIMLPPAPKQTYIDVYLDEEGASSSNFENEKRLQANYEAEVKVYRALERLEEDILVLHGFEYSHHQYRICDTSHVRKNCMKCRNARNREGECDFVVIGRNYFIIIEVKNIPHTDITEAKTRELIGALRKSQEQGEKVKFFIESIITGAGTEQCPMFNFSAFPSTNRNIMNLDEEHKKQILCTEDFLDFSSWWRTNVTESITENATHAFLTKHEEVKEVLVAIWSTDKNMCDESKCSLGNSIMDIDEELRKGSITFLSKNRTPNPNVIKSIDIEAANINTEINVFRDITGVDNLTAEQSDAFHRDQNLLVINGPAGSGKTIILLAKIIQRIKDNEENRVVLFIFALDMNSRNRYQDTLVKANISNGVLPVAKYWSASDLHNTVQNILVSMQENQVVIVQTEQLSRVLGELQLIGSNAHIFIDDYQADLYREEENIMVPILQQLSKTNQVWVTCDLTQISSFSFHELGDTTVQAFIKDMPCENIVTLSLNLRNTSDIAGILSHVREQLVQDFPEEETANIDVVLPVVKPGHFIHGPRTVVHFIEKSVYNERLNKDVLKLIVNIVNMELDKLCNTGASRGFQVGIVGNYSFSNPITSTVKKIIAKRSSNISDDEIELCGTDNCFSAEYPAVIVLHDVLNHNIPSLYLEISRARVYCAVILFSTSTTLYEVKFLNDLLNKLEDSVRIIRHKNTDD